MVTVFIFTSYLSPIEGKMLIDLAEQRGMRASAL